MKHPKQKLALSCRKGLWSRSLEHYSWFFILSFHFDSVIKLGTNYNIKNRIPENSLFFFDTNRIQTGGSQNEQYNLIEESCQGNWFIEETFSASGCFFIWILDLNWLRISAKLTAAWRKNWLLNKSKFAVTYIWMFPLFPLKFCMSNGEKVLVFMWALSSPLLVSYPICIKIQLDHLYEIRDRVVIFNIFMQECAKFAVTKNKVFVAIAKGLQETHLLLHRKFTFTSNKHYVFSENWIMLV